MEKSIHTDEMVPAISSFSSDSDIDMEEEKQVYVVSERPPNWWYYREGKKNSTAQPLTKEQMFVQSLWERRCKQMNERMKAEDSGRERKKSLTDEDFLELSGALRMGFAFDEENSTESIRNSFPALDFYFAVKGQTSPTAPRIDTWLFDAGDTEERKKKRLRLWTKAVVLHEYELKKRGIKPRK
ncbi:carboxylate clamp-TPR protein (DUF1685) [Rhynchospora pubera]|uniref:Carboxylate clamp-TPR protein (DUF1685) n=1 Tax=Rhynchospora pubera TaxID=906938 RepID=A0AAV8HFE7_9POAL|nr:carboxylate clamp-TPR protein (DUF1685) [Rhynchospora pubera]KAJ4814605.1 carboxylate clamp-TPR protein (DUF1685) [Rhynchospora pubera]